MEMTKDLRDKIVTILYEKCANGEISLGQREMLIRKANKELMITEGCKLESGCKTEAADKEEAPVEEPAAVEEPKKEEAPAETPEAKEQPEEEPKTDKETIEEIDKDVNKKSKKLTPKEKFDKVSARLYEMEKNGEIDEAKREELIALACKKFCPDCKKEDKAEEETTPAK